eukprot:TRINITY_DN10219_c0_g1_i1.p2 TRINITY_DN10219_c0_g1~~TRINITY_DN10219_c0_g1_i1.p2  ORF type:complete len:111 (+),score=30.90 TRINITY_DN10219_c0_g1_i1:191-523(+)
MPAGELLTVVSPAVIVKEAAECGFRPIADLTDVPKWTPAGKGSGFIRVPPKRPGYTLRTQRPAYGTIEDLAGGEQSARAAMLAREERIRAHLPDIWQWSTVGAEPSARAA